ncbi:hypothetical protein NLI96_g149 [Meripilus lineatus]|uniref:1-alkyl-2-acetylglycerophosphocholine esterase n=1 Tax=Meripilus lineatus TaxID=2056292 RepID=A0AAD5VCW6_9APHY|nr:hypothetical protein NLI96_g149 [Physisporinus lineatus]
MSPSDLLAHPAASPPLDQLRSRSSIDFSSSLRPELIHSPASVQPPQKYHLDQDEESRCVQQSAGSSSPGTQTPTPAPSPITHQESSMTPTPSRSDEGPQTFQIVNKRSPFGAILSRTLPSYTGDHVVGVCDVEVPVKKQTFGYFEHKSMPSRGAGLTIDTVFFTLFYPSVKRETNSRVVWFPRLRQTIDGFLKMANRTPNWMYRTVTYPAAAAAIYGTTFPAIENGHLKVPPPSASGEPQKWPVMIFSHGVGCSRLMYSAFCGEMASRGYIVAAIEHRDGTGPSSKIINSEGEKKVLDWLSWKDLHWPGCEQPQNDTTLRHVQLQVRLAEVERVLQTLQKIASGEKITQTKTTEAQTQFDWVRWARSVDVEKPIMAGHSFGGSLGMAAAADGRFDFSKVVVFDPAVQRLFPWKGKIASPIEFLAINSEEFAFGAEFPMLVEMLGNIEQPNVFLIPGSTHPSFSDVFLILPDYLNRLTGLRIDADKVIDMSVHVVERFLLDRVHEITTRTSRAAWHSLDGGRPVLTTLDSAGTQSTSGKRGSTSDSKSSSSASQRQPEGSKSQGTQRTDAGTSRHSIDVVEITGEAHMRRVKDGVQEGKSAKIRGKTTRRKSGLGDVGGMVLFRTAAASRL